MQPVQTAINKACLSKAAPMKLPAKGFIARKPVR
jgi:hypothetical protein